MLAIPAKPLAARGSAMLVSKKSHVTQAFVLTPNDLQRICERLQQLGLEVTCQGECTDFVRPFDSLPDLLHFDNSLRQRMLDLEARAHSKDGNTYVNLLLDSQSVNRNVSLEIGGDEITAATLNSIVGDWLAVITPWYGPLARLGSRWPSWVASAGIGFGLALLLEGVVSGQRPLLASRGWLVAVAIVLGFAACGLRAPVFPMSVLAFGHGQKRHKDMEIIRTAVVLAFVVSLIASIAAALILAN